MVLCLGDNSAVRMVSPSIVTTQLDLLRGTAMVEVDQIEPENNLLISDHGTNVRLEKKGLYSFNADQPMVAVYDGKATLVLADKSYHVDKGGTDAPARRESSRL